MIAIIGMASFWFNFIGINLLVSGLHSYAGVEADRGLRSRLPAARQTPRETHAPTSQQLAPRRVPLDVSRLWHRDDHG